MPSRMMGTQRPGQQPGRPSGQRPPHDALDNYYPDDDFDDPFASPEPEGQGQKSNAPGSLGIDEEVSVQKRARVPRVKLDESRLLSDKGIPSLRRRARDLKLKGKGHEFSDAARLLSFYQLWLDDLFPKAKFLDALAMVEKEGHKTSMHKMRMEWINEGKPRPAAADALDHDEQEGQQEGEKRSPPLPTGLAPIFNTSSTGRPRTPVAEDLFGDEDIYGATPRGPRPGGTAATSLSIFGGGEVSDGARPSAMPQPDEDDLDALMAEAEAEVEAGAPRTVPTGDGDDDLDALMAEAEAEAHLNDPQPAVFRSIFGDGTPSGPPRPVGDAGDLGDDLDALMAETEALSQLPRPETPGHKEPFTQEETHTWLDEEEAMAEMDGL